MLYLQVLYFETLSSLAKEEYPNECEGEVNKETLRISLYHHVQAIQAHVHL